jgi:hypothetical protein
MPWGLMLLRLRAVPLKTWAAIAGAVAALALAVWLFQAGRGAERDDQADRSAKVEAKTAKGREKAATERAVDTNAVNDRLQEWNHAAEQIPDTAPDDRELRRRCRQLRDAGHGGLAACRGLEGGTQAEAGR